MKKRFLFFGGLLCAFVITSCQKSIKNSNLNETEISTVANNSSNRQPALTFFDPSGLVSASQHGVLDTIQKGFGFTEGPAVDKMGNVFFTDQPNDKIYRWDAVSGEVTLFLSGTGRANGMAFDKNGDLIAMEDPSGCQP